MSGTSPVVADAVKAGDTFSLSTFTAQPGGDLASGGPALEPDDIVVVPPPHAFVTGNGVSESAISQGFALAARLLHEGKAVRLVGEGVTLRSAWPDWVHKEPRLLLTEWGAFRAADPVSGSQPIRDAIRCWLDRTFAGLLPHDLPPASALYSVACVRLFQLLFNLAPYLDGLVARYAAARFHCADPRWLEVLTAGVRSGNPGAFGWAARTRWRLKLLGLTVFAMGRSSLSLIRQCVRARSAIRCIERHQAGRRGPGASVWMAIVPVWGDRAAAHVFDTVGKEALECGHSPGVLITSSLAQGDGSGDLAKPEERWPVLRSLLTTAPNTPIAQVVLPRSWAGLVRVAAGAVHTTARAAWRLAKHLPRLHGQGLDIDLENHLGDLALLLGNDVAVARATAEATETFLSNFPRPVSVVFAMLGLADSAAANAILQHAGVPTVDFVHGSGGDSWSGASETFATARAVWTHGDAEQVEARGCEAIVTGNPRPTVALLPPARAEKVRVLLLTNYVHISWRGAGFPLRHLQSELLRAARLLLDAYPGRLEIQWRPHPSDAPELIDADLRASRGITRSAGSLEDALRWSHIIISTNSSSIVESLEWERPLLLHVSPAQRYLPEVRAIDARRQFFHAETLVDLVGNLIDRLAADEDVTAPERATRECLLGRLGPSKWAKFIVPAAELESNARARF